MNRVSFHGDASLPHYVHGGHFEYSHEVNGIPTWESVKVPRELWGEGYPWCTDKDREYYRQWDHRQFLPYVQLRPEDKPCGQSRGEGQGAGTAQITYTASHTVFACWDYTGDVRGGSYSMFWIDGRLSANDMITAINRDFPCIWARITGGSGAMHVWGDDPPPVATALDVVAVAKVATSKAEPAPTYDFSIPDELFVRAAPTPELVQIVEDATPVANEQLRSAMVKP
jgi:hypothetical protein